ncbi:MAG: hypothetical protein A2946_03525 [Candidatus Liptonbacteria bacterium RIFCSPLOWO2_01_FULL_53_13]|uniref:Zinc-binding domain-containing protein n=1 Tax=Candidatus Liptonbacteria bacterium RIFCSPLOWO2_01_FULL_53_13 TaxID=1798651 RepID=A0A1G2CIY7_9BACT|nr:MAG: hypothetical protein A2946_03525 [Candidatus Liptonbacteria bacterium RIFCSPLOWO2_01_FULL_53_13]
MSEKRSCQNCQSEFTIKPEDFDFYGKIKVPPPTFCPECRAVRRMTWRNERTLYKRKCDATGKDIITMFAPESGLKVYERDYWWSDDWDQLNSGREYDFSKPFFVQYRELFSRAPLPNLANTNVTRSEYGNHNADCKNCYLLYASFRNENVHYSSGSIDGKDSMDMYIIERAEQCYEDSFGMGLHKVFFSYDSDDSMDSSFIHACKNMSDCIGCINLRNKSFHIWNTPYSKEEYKKKLAEFDLGSYAKLQKIQTRFKEFIANYPRRHVSILKSVNSTGDMMVNAKNCKNCFDGFGGVEDSKYIIHAAELKDSYDGYGLGGHAELLYESVDSGIQASRYKSAVYVHGCHDVGYAYCCHSSSYLFGCVGLRSKKYCILNKQYTKEEYESLVPKIIAHMNEMPYESHVTGHVSPVTYKYGEFFPSDISPFAYNETIAQEYYPLTEENALAKGYVWKTPAEKNYEISMRAEALPDHINAVKDEILNEVIGCMHEGKCTHQCTTAFKIIPEELQFYRQHNLALPRLCSNCRHYERLARRNPFKLWHRACQCAGKKSENGVYANTGTHSSHTNGEHCHNEFETAYAPERPEIIYCEQCYQAEVA